MKLRTLGFLVSLAAGSDLAQENKKDAPQEWRHGPYDKNIQKRATTTNQSKAPKTSGAVLWETAPNSLSEAEKNEGWKLLFDGKTLNGWRLYSGAAFSNKGWTVENGYIKNAKNTGRPGSGEGDVLTTEQFVNFDLRFDWRISTAGNSGVKYFVKERKGEPGAKMYAGDDGKSAVGHEYQVLDDDKHPDGKNGPIRQSGSLYSLIAPNPAKKLNPVGEFNYSRILVQDKHVEHWLNGEKVLEYELGSKRLMDIISKSKYKDVPGFGTKFPAAILLQDHGDEVWFRNVKIRELGP
jgi:hypothetical protein